MPKGIYIRTNDMNTGKYKRSEETKNKMSLSKLGNKVWLGRKQTEEAKRKLSETRKRLFAKGKIQNNFLGKHHTEETKLKMSLSKVGKPNLLLKGKHYSKEHNRKVSETKKRLYAEGKIKPWCKGLTKETDERVLRGALNMIGKNAGKTGELSNAWLGGKSFEPYTKDFNMKFKKAIKERDGCCMLCNIGFEDLKLLKRYVYVHHIDYNKLNSFPQNCISLCNSCHTKTNFNREQWKLFFQSLLKKRYGYLYSEDQKIIFDFNLNSKGGVK